MFISLIYCGKKDTNYSQKMEKAHEAESATNKVQTFKGVLPSGVTQDALSFPAMSCGNTCEMLPIRAVIRALVLGDVIGS
jgi:hypothetical protein